MVSAIPARSGNSFGATKITYISPPTAITTPGTEKSKNSNGFTFISIKAELTRRLVEEPINVVMPPKTAA